jgi:hypothetical protein
MQNVIYDERTAHSRLMVGYDRYGITIREWSESDGGDVDYRVTERSFTWEDYRTRDRCYSGDDGSGKLKARLVAGAISLLAYWGGSSDSTGEVDSLDEYMNGSHVFTC